MLAACRLGRARIPLGSPEAGIGQSERTFQLPQPGGAGRPHTVHLGPVEVTAVAVVARLDPQVLQR